jgi:hypothetical protein
VLTDRGAEISASSWQATAGMPWHHGRFDPVAGTEPQRPRNVFNYLQKKRNGWIIAPALTNEEPSPMWIRESDRSVQYNWIAIFSYTASLAVSLAIWKGLFRAVQLLVK